MSVLRSKELFQARVSSVLNRDVQSCGKQFMFDGNDESCWCSDQGTPQWLAINLMGPVRLHSLQIQFQGGFVGRDCQLVMANASDQKKTIDFYPEDVNTVQHFDLDFSFVCSKVTINFPSSTDFFGRIVIYKLDLCGERVSK